MKLGERKSNHAQNKNNNKNNKKVESFSEFAVDQKFQSYAASFSKDELCSRMYVGKSSSRLPWDMVMR